MRLLRATYIITPGLFRCFLFHSYQYSSSFDDDGKRATAGDASAVIAQDCLFVGLV
jgi:hypothetical protein